MDLLRIALEEHGVNCELLVATDGEKALRFIEEIGAGSLGCPALAILDLNLPKRTGREVLQRMRESPHWKSIPVVIFSSSDSAADRAETAQLGVHRYITKPSSLDAFVQIGGVLKELLTAQI